MALLPVFPLPFNGTAVVPALSTETHMRCWLDTLAERREVALVCGDNAAVARSEDHIIRCELFLLEVEAWHAARLARWS